MTRGNLVALFALFALAIVATNFPMAQLLAFVAMGIIIISVFVRNGAYRPSRKTVESIDAMGEDRLVADLEKRVNEYLRTTKTLNELYQGPKIKEVKEHDWLIPVLSSVDFIDVGKFIPEHRSVIIKEYIARNLDVSSWHELPSQNFWTEIHGDEGLLVKKEEVGKARLLN